jgi:transcriptional regulator with XRE-family HTH domain
MENQIPKRLKELRQQKQFTLEQLARRAGCTKSYISQLEKGTSAPSVSMLGRLADALEVHVVDLFRDDTSGRQGNWHLRKIDRRTIYYPDGKVISQLLTKGVFQKKMQPLLSVIKPGGMLNNSGTMVHPKGSEEFVLVLKGEVEFEIGSKRLFLQVGDTLYFNGDIPHHWVNTGRETAEVLFVWTPPVW